MVFKLVRLAFLVSSTVLLVGTWERPVQAAICCLDCIDIRNEYWANCVDENGNCIDSQYCNDLWNQLHFCTNVCTVSACGNTNVSCSWVPGGPSPDGVIYVCHD